MPSTRKSGHAPAAAKQSKLSFAHRVTKPAGTHGKDLAAGPSPLSKVVLPEKTPPPSKTPEGEEEEEEVAEVVVEETQLEDDSLVEPEPAPEPVKSAAELKAEKITDAQVAKYWRALEAERISHRVHQEDLDVGEKVLRYFDVSSQYGPCIGIQRMKRWMRAEKLGLNPPIEVLAVLLKLEQKGTPGVERAHMDAIMSSTAVGATS